MRCRFCNTEINNENIFADLNNCPASNSFLTKNQLNEPEIYYPLKTFVCSECKLVQIDEYKKSDDIFNKDYAYFSSYSSSWLKHAQEYVSMIIEKINLSENSFVTEIASNDGYLLQYFKEKNIPCLGIEPTNSTAKVARDKGINIIEDFFTYELSEELNKSDLIIGNNVLAHVPNINDFVKGLKNGLKDTGIITLEFPHLLNLIEENQFDTIYHEHYSYLSLFTVEQIFNKHDLKIFDIDILKTHGGSLRIYATHIDNQKYNISQNVTKVKQKEQKHKLNDLSIYKNFQENINKIKNQFLNFLLEAKNNNKKVIAYGAAAKGNTLLNYCGIKKDLISFVVDKSPHKQNKFLPSSHIPILNENEIKIFKPDYIIILPWNIKDEIMHQLAYTKEWNCEFVTAIPKLTIEKEIND